jgi:hypothetical protein
VLYGKQLSNSCPSGKRKYHIIRHYFLPNIALSTILSLNQRVIHRLRNGPGLNPASGNVVVAGFSLTKAYNLGFIISGNHQYNSRFHSIMPDIYQTVRGRLLGFGSLKAVKEKHGLCVVNDISYKGINPG